MSELNRRREDQNFDYSVLSYQSMLARPLESMVEIQLPGDVDHTPVRPFKFEVVDGSPRLAVVDRSLSVQAIPTVFLPGLITFDPVDLGKAEGTILFAFQYLQQFEGIERQLRVVEVSGDGAVWATGFISTIGAWIWAARYLQLQKKKDITWLVSRSLP